eukprot:826901_1
MALILAAFIHIYSVFGAFEWIPSTSEPNIEYYYIAQCMAFNLDVGTNACKAIDANAILVTIPAISVQSDLANNVIDGYPGSCSTGGCCSSAYGAIGTGGTYISKTLNVGGTIRWLDGGPDTSNLIHYSTSPASPRVALPDWPGLCLTTVPSQNGNAMDCGWSAPGIHHGAAAICKRSTLNPSTTGPTMLTKEPTSMPTKNPTGIPSVIPSTSMPTKNPTGIQRIFPRQLLHQTIQQNDLQHNPVPEHGTANSSTVTFFVYLLYYIYG